MPLVGNISQNAVLQATATAADANDKERWADYRNGDFQALVKRLREERYPTTLIRGMVVAAVREKYEKLRFEARIKPAQYWQNQQRYLAKMPTLKNPEEDVAQEENNLLLSLLGEDLYPEDLANKKALEKLHFGDIPSDKIEKLRTLAADYKEIGAGISKTSSSATEALDQEKWWLLEREREGDIKKLLTPAEFLDYELRTSASADATRQALRTFDATEEEFRAMFEVRKAFDLKHPKKVNFTQSEAAEWEAAIKELPTKYGNVLGEHRYREYLKSIEDDKLAARREIIRRQ